MKYIMMIIALALPMMVHAQIVPGGNPWITDDTKVPAFWYNRQSWDADAYMQSAECGHPFGPPSSAGTHCYVETLNSVAGWRKSGDQQTWILFLAYQKNAFPVNRPHLITPDPITGRPYAGTVYPLTSPAAAVPVMCLSLFGCSNH